MEKTTPNQKNRGSIVITAVLVILIISVGIAFWIYYSQTDKPAPDKSSPPLQETSAPLQQKTEELPKTETTENAPVENNRAAPPSSDDTMIKNLAGLQTAVEDYLDYSNEGTLPKLSPASWDILIQTVQASASAPLSLSDGDYCYYVDDLQKWYVLAAFLKNAAPSDDQFDIDLTFAGRNFTLVSSRGSDQTACPNPQAQDTVLACSDDSVYCLFGGNKPGKQKARDAERIADLKQLQALVEVLAAGSAPGLYPAATSGALGRDVSSVIPPDSRDVYCYYVSPDKLRYIWSAQTLENQKNAAQGYNGTTHTGAPSAWGVYEIKQKGGTDVCAPPGPNIPDCDDTSANTYCLMGTTST